MTLRAGIGIDINLVKKISGSGFITEWTVAGDAVARTITLPLIQNRTEGALAYNCTVDWGDGSALSTVTAYNDADRIHTYAANGTYQVEIKGTCEGWSFNNAGDKLKIRKVINWGSILFDGFKYLKGAFHGCTGLTTLGTGYKNIPKSGTGVLTDGFENFCSGCTSLASIPGGLFDLHTEVTTRAFVSVFYNCFVLQAIPADLFKYNTKCTTVCFYTAFFECKIIPEIPVDLFRYNTLITTYAFHQTFRGCRLITEIPVDLFRYNTLVSDHAFYDTFQTCLSLVTIPQDIFRYNTLVSLNGFEGTFIECAMTSLPNDLFRYNTEVSVNGFNVCFDGCTQLQTIPDDLFRYNTKVSTGGFYSVFSRCLKLQLKSNIFGSDLTTRFLANPTDLRLLFNRASFAGIQGTAPELWNAVFPDKVELNVLPLTAWTNGDIITGQTSGVTAEVCGRFGTWVYLVINRTGNFTAGEIIGVTGVPNKLADQGAGYPIVTDSELITDCFNGAGNSLVSISNYGDIPAPWL